MPKVKASLVRKSIPQVNYGKSSTECSNTGDVHKGILDNINLADVANEYANRKVANKHQTFFSELITTYVSFSYIYISYHMCKTWSICNSTTVLVFAENDLV